MNRKEVVPDKEFPSEWIDMMKEMNTNVAQVAEDTAEIAEASQTAKNAVLVIMITAVILGFLYVGVLLFFVFGPGLMGI